MQPIQPPHSARTRQVSRVAALLVVAALAAAASGRSEGVTAGGPGAPHGPGAASPAPDRPDFTALAAEGRRRSRYLDRSGPTRESASSAGGVEAFRSEVEPILRASCLECHGPEKSKGGLRIDALDPDLAAGDDGESWVDVLAAVEGGDMPPTGDAGLAPADRARLVEWLSGELRTASLADGAAQEPSAFRRLTRTEYGFVLQDLLGLPNSFGDDLPPDPVSESGFQNSAEVLHLSTAQLEAYLDSSRAALDEAVALGARPEPLHWSVSMDAAAAVEWRRLDGQLEELRRKHADDPAALATALQQQREREARRPGGVHFEDRSSGRFAQATWGYDGAKRAWAPSATAPEPPGDATAVAVLPAKGGLIVELGDRLPDRGLMRVRVRAARASADDARPASLRLMFGWQASNDSNAVVRVSDEDLLVDAPPDAPRTYEWIVPMCRATPRNLARGANRMGDLPSPSEFVKLVNASLSGRTLHLHHVEVTAPFVEAWPPASYARVFPARPDGADEETCAEDALRVFMTRAWRRPPSEEELRRKLDLFRELRPGCASFEEAVVDVLAVVLASPSFLFVSPTATDGAGSDHDLATRLALFLWCSGPDDGLLARAAEGDLRRPEVLERELDRMLADPRARRLSRVFVSQWLDLALMENLRVDRKAYPDFDAGLKEAMAAEPIAFFDEVLRRDASVLELLHSDFAVVDERLAAHYGIQGVTGNHLRPVALDPRLGRGGLLVQAGPLAMNSDGKDSHPLKRGVWLLESILDDPPPPPPPAVPKIDLADPAVARMTLKERIEDHRDDPACFSCHAQIDPWGIAFEHFDAVGRWRAEAGGRPVDAVSVLPGDEVLDGADGVKAFVLLHRQDDFVRALTKKLATHALGREVGFRDREALERVVARVRANGDGLATMVKAIATSDLFLGH